MNRKIQKRVLDYFLVSPLECTIHFGTIYIMIGKLYGMSISLNTISSEARHCTAFFVIAIAHRQWLSPMWLIKSLKIVPQ